MLTNKFFSPKKKVTVDTETTGFDSWTGDQPFGVGMCDEEGETWYCEWNVNPFTRVVTPEIDSWNVIDKVLRDESITKIFHNSRFDIRQLLTVDLHVKGRVEDTYFAARIHNNISRQLGLKYLAKHYCDVSEDDMYDLHAEVLRYRKMARDAGWKIADSAYADYWIPRTVDENHRACETYCRQDCVRTMHLHMFYEHVFKRETHYRGTYERELDLLQIVLKMEQSGVGISQEKCIFERDESKAVMDDAYNKMRDMVGHDFNANSSKQLAVVLYDELGLKILEHTANGEPSSRITAIRPHAAHPFVNLLLTYRSAHKSIGTFFDNYLQKMVRDPKHVGCWMLHPQINQCATVTGRFSMSDPNLQQVANANTSTLGGRMVMARRPFGPRPGYAWYPMDYAQQELRIFTSLAKIKLLGERIRLGKDPNTENANLAWGGKDNPAAIYAARLALELKDPIPSKPEVMAMWKKYGWDPEKTRSSGGMESKFAKEIAEDWLKTYDYDIVVAEKTLGKANTRSRCKIVMFDIVYGGGANSLCKLLFCELKEAREYLSIMHKRYPEIKRYTEKLMGELSVRGYIVNAYGRRLKTDVGREYTCVNYIVQGSAADMMKDSMVRCQKFIDDSGLDARMVLTVHDELVFEVAHRHSYQWFLRGLNEIMEDNEGRFDLPMKVEASMAQEQWDRKIPVSYVFRDDDLIYDFLPEYVAEQKRIKKENEDVRLAKLAEEAELAEAMADVTHEDAEEAVSSYSFKRKVE